MEEHRTQRVSQAVRDELAEMIGFEMDDPRLTDVSVTGVEVSPDMRSARVKVAVDEAMEKKALLALEHAKGFLKHELAGRLNLRRIPDLFFSVDSHPDADSRIEF